MNHEHELRVVRVLTSAQVLSGLGIAGTVAAGSLLVSSISNSETLAGLAQTSGVLGAAAMAIPLSRLTRLGGRRLALTTGYIVGAGGAVIAIVGGTTRSLLLMLVGAFLVGAASAAGYQARFAAVDLASDHTRSRRLSFIVWGSTVGAVAGPNLMSPSGNLAESFGLPRLVGPYLLALTTLSIAAALINIFLRPDPYLLSIMERNANEIDDENEPVHYSPHATLRAIRHQGSALFAMVSIAIGHFVMVSVMVMTPIHMAHVDVTLKIIGLVISVHVAGMYALSPLVGYLSDWLGRKRIIQIGLLILLIACVVAGRSPGANAVSLGAGLFLLGLGWSCTLIAGSALLAESITDEYRSSSQGTSDLAMNLVGAAGGALAGVIIANLSYGWLCAIAAFPVLILGIWSVNLAESSHSIPEVSVDRGKLAS